MNRRELLRVGAVAGAVGTVGIGRLLAFPEAALAAAEKRRAAAGGEPGSLRLNANENPMGLAPAARQAVSEALGDANRYPDALRRALEEALATRLGVATDNIVLGNGSTEVLQMVVQAASSPNATLVLADPTFEAVSRYQQPMPYRLEKVPLTADFAHDVERMRQRTESPRRPALVYLCNPNNPTGTLTPSDAIDAWIAEAPESVLFVVDEAYYDYVRDPRYRSAVRWVGERPNVIVARTFSKVYGMAGMRLGYAVAQRDTAQRLREFMSSDNANVLALAAALASLADDGWVEQSVASNRAAKEVTTRCLDELELAWLPSHTNFLMHQVRGDLDRYIERMRERRIRVGRPFPPMLAYNRVSLGLPAEMERFAEVLRDFRRRGWV